MRLAKNGVIDGSFTADPRCPILGLEVLLGIQVDLQDMQSVYNTPIIFVQGNKAALHSIASINIRILLIASSPKPVTGLPIHYREFFTAPG